MMPIRSSLAVAVLIAIAAPAGAASSAASSASEGVSASVGGTSTSIETSSNSSSKGDRTVAEGAYRVAAVGEVPGRTGFVRLQLEPLGDGAAAFALVLPQTAVETARLASGDVVQATHRAYGVEFARGDDRRAFFLVVDDAWQQDLRTRPVRG